jgi:hypothetical protein
MENQELEKKLAISKAEDYAYRKNAKNDINFDIEGFS